MPLWYIVLQHTTAYCDVLQHTRTYYNIYDSMIKLTTTHYNILQHTTCSLLRRSTAHRLVFNGPEYARNIPESYPNHTRIIPHKGFMRRSVHEPVLQHTTAHYNVLQHTYYSVLQHAATYHNELYRTTNSELVLRRLRTCTNLHHGVRVCAMEYEFVLQGTGL